MGILQSGHNNIDECAPACPPSPQEGQPLLPLQLARLLLTLPQTAAARQGSPRPSHHRDRTIRLRGLAAALQFPLPLWRNGVGCADGDAGGQLPKMWQIIGILIVANLQSLYLGRQTEGQSPLQRLPRVRDGLQEGQDRQLQCEGGQVGTHRFHRELPEFDSGQTDRGQCEECIQPGHRAAHYPSQQDHQPTRQRGTPPPPQESQHAGRNASLLLLQRLRVTSPRSSLPLPAVLGLRPLRALLLLLRPPARHEARVEHTRKAVAEDVAGGGQAKRIPPAQFVLPAHVAGLREQEAVADRPSQVIGGGDGLSAWWCMVRYGVKWGGVWWFAREENIKAASMLPSESRNGSLLQAKCQQYRVSIRNEQMATLRQQKRQQLLTISAIDQLVHHLPTESAATLAWASELMTIYGPSRYRLTPDRVVSLFRLVEKFPNMVTLQLLEVVVIRADVTAVNEMFQYDVVKLLHGIINFATRAVQRPLDDSPEGKIVQEAVVNAETEERLEEEMRGENGNTQREMVKVAIRVLCEICRKGEHVRNFTMLNHRSYTYCLKAYKLFGSPLRSDYLQFLLAVTHHPFTRQEQPFEVVSTKIMHFFHTETFDFSSPPMDLTDYATIILAYKSILRMKVPWVSLKIMTLISEQPTYIYDRIVNILSTYTSNYPYGQFVEPSPGRLLEAALTLIMAHMQMLQQAKIVISYEKLTFQIFRFLRQNLNGMGISAHKEPRRACYFLMSNEICSIKSPHRQYCLQLLRNTNPQDNLIGVLVGLLQLESSFDNQRELIYCLCSIVDSLPLHIIEPLLLPSELFPVLITRITETHSWTHQEVSTESNLKHLGVDLLLTFFSRDELGSRMQMYRGLVWEQWGERLLRAAGRTEAGLGAKMEALVGLVQAA